MVVTEFSIIPFDHRHWHKVDMLQRREPLGQIQREPKDATMMGPLIDFFCCSSERLYKARPARKFTETATVGLAIPQRMIAKLILARTILQRASRHKFQFFQQVQDSSSIYLIGTWDSPAAHEAFLRSDAAVFLRRLLMSDISQNPGRPVRVGFLDLDILDYPDVARQPDVNQSWLSSARSLFYDRYFVVRKDTAKVVEGLDYFIPYLRNRNCAIGGWRTASVAKDMEEMVLFSNTSTSPTMEIKWEDPSLVLPTIAAKVHQMLDSLNSVERQELRRIDEVIPLLHTGNIDSYFS